MKFSEIEYKRFTFEEAAEGLNAALAALENAQTAEDAFRAVEMVEKVGCDMETMPSVAYVRHTMDTTDKFYEGEQDYIDEIGPKIAEIGDKVRKAAAASKFRPEMEREFGELYFKNIDIALKAFSPAIVDDMQTDNKLCTEYQKLMSGAKIDFEGKSFTRAQLGFYKEHKDRATRRAAFEADAVWLNENRDQLDEIFDKMVKTRDAMGRKLGYKNYIELGYYAFGRNDYYWDEVAAFRAQIADKIVPVVNKVKADQAKRLGIDAVALYDDTVLFPDGNAEPHGEPAEMFEAARKMYADLSPETKEFFAYMLEHDLFDVLTRDGKSGGGYCITIPNFKFPFIFANWNKTAGDVDVLTHEAGHAFAAYTARDMRVHSLANPTFEACEVHSMSMEFFTWPWMENFFAQADKYRYAHLASSLSFIPYGAIVDEFQHIIYAEPNLTPNERCRVYADLEAKYRPYLQYKDMPFYGEGRRWQIQSHIYERPFYYIDYCLAQTVALHFWAMSRENFAPAWEKYLKFVRLAGTKPFSRLLKESDLPSPFGEKMLGDVARAATDFLDK